MRKRFLSALLAACLLLTAVCGAVPAMAEEMKNREEQPIRVDLTKMSAIMIYGLMYDIVSSPMEYEGQKMRLVGEYSSFKNPETGEMEHTITFYDTSFCCHVDLRFYLKGDAVYPKDYPRDGSQMTVVGFLHVEGEGKKATCWLEDGKLE